MINEILGTSRVLAKILNSPFGISHYFKIREPASVHILYMWHIHILRKRLYTLQNRVNQSIKEKNAARGRGEGGGGGT